MQDDPPRAARSASRILYLASFFHPASFFHLASRIPHPASCILHLSSILNLTSARKASSLPRIIPDNPGLFPGFIGRGDRPVCKLRRNS